MVFELLRDMIVEATGCDESEVTPAAALREDLSLTEGELTQIVEAMAHELGFRFEEIELDEVTTTRDLVRCISALL